MQIGLSYYLAIQTFTMALCFASPEKMRELLNTRTLLCVFLAYGMVASTALYPGAGTGDILKAGREAICLLLVVSALGSSMSLDLENGKSYFRIIAVIAIGLLFLVAAQGVFLSRGIYFGLPQDLFVINSGTLPDELDLIYSRLRPSGTFGEPSYLAAFCVTLAAAISPLWSTSRKAQVLFLVLVAVTYMSLSMLGVLAISVLLCLRLVQSDKHWVIVFLVLLASGVSVLAIFSINSEILDRIGAIARGEDVSASSRIFIPLMSLPDILSVNPFGIPLRIFSDMGFLPGVNVPNKSFTHNSIFNVVINYGFVGVCMLGFMFWSAKGFLLKFVLFVLLMQNGSFLAFDKVTLIALLVLIYNTTLHQRAVKMELR